MKYITAIAALGLSPSGEPSAFGIFASRLRDLARYGMLYTPSRKIVASEPVIADDYLPKVYAAAKQGRFAGNLGDHMIAHFGNLDMGASYQWMLLSPTATFTSAAVGGNVCISHRRPTPSSFVFRRLKKDLCGCMLTPARSLNRCFGKVNREAK